MMLFWPNLSGLFWASFPAFFWGDYVAYSYDSIGRLNTLVFRNTTEVEYNLDSVGNRTSVAITCSSSGC
jgi:hypothetical protein